MMRISQFALFGLVVGALVGVSAAAQAQGAPDVKRGKTLFESKGCNGCHTIGGGRRAGPDLKGVTTRRSREWLQKWIKDPDAMLASDSTAQQLMKEANGIKMVNPHLNSDADINALIDYLDSKK
jgi:cytochrome c2